MKELLKWKIGQSVHKEVIEIKKKKIRQGLSWWSSGYNSMLPMQGAEVRSLVRELRSHMPQLRVRMPQ